MLGQEPPRGPLVLGARPQPSEARRPSQILGFDLEGGPWKTRKRSKVPGKAFKVFVWPVRPSEAFGGPQRPLEASLLYMYPLL